MDWIQFSCSAHFVGIYCLIMEKVWIISIHIVRMSRKKLLNVWMDFRTKTMKSIACISCIVKHVYRNLKSHCLRNREKKKADVARSVHRPFLLFYNFANHQCVTSTDRNFSLITFSMDTYFCSFIKEVNFIHIKGKCNFLPWFIFGTSIYTSDKSLTINM